MAATKNTEATPAEAKLLSVKSAFESKYRQSATQRMLAAMQGNTSANGINQKLESLARKGLVERVTLKLSDMAADEETAAYFRGKDKNGKSRDNETVIYLSPASKTERERELEGMLMKIWKRARSGETVNSVDIFEDMGLPESGLKRIKISPGLAKKSE